MKKLLTFALLILPTYALANEVDCDNAVTTIEINACIGETVATAEAQLAQYIAKAKTRHVEESSVIDLLNQSQHAWLAYRKAHCDAIYDMWSDGSIRGAMFGGCMAQLTKQRTHQIWADYLTYMD
jgi:uncharacterized protein YecT (DUF1311 family)